MRLQVRYAAILLPILHGACGDARPAAEPSFVGRWRATSFSIEIPPACLQATLELRANGTLTSQSGEQVLTATYTIKPRGAGHLLTITDLESNGRANCQGIPAQYLLAHHVTETYVEIAGDTVRMRLGPEAFSSMVRVRD